MARTCLKQVETRSQPPGIGPTRPPWLAAVDHLQLAGCSAAQAPIADQPEPWRLPLDRSSMTEQRETMMVQDGCGYLMKLDREGGSNFQRLNVLELGVTGNNVELMGCW